MQDIIVFPDDTDRNRWYGPPIMGKASRQTPWWQQSLFWGPFGILMAIILALAVVAILKDVRWLLFVAWPCLLVSLWVATQDIKSWRVRAICIVIVVVLAALGHYVFHSSLGPSQISQISDAQLCSQAKTFAQRMRDFEHERWARHDDNIDRFRSMTGEAKTEEEKQRLRKQSTEELNTWLNRYRNDFDNNFRPEAKRLWSELLNRLPRQPKQIIPDEFFFYGPLAGAFPVREMADRIEILAKKLCPGP